MQVQLHLRVFYSSGCRIAHAFSLLLWRQSLFLHPYRLRWYKNCTTFLSQWRFCAQSTSGGQDSSSEWEFCLSPQRRDALHTPASSWALPLTTEPRNLSVFFFFFVSLSLSDILIVLSKFVLGSDNERRLQVLLLNHLLCILIRDDSQCLLKHMLPKGEYSQIDIKQISGSLALSLHPTYTKMRR